MRQGLRVTPGSQVLYKDERFVVRNLISLSKVLADRVSDGEPHILPMAELYEWTDGKTPPRTQELVSLSDEELAAAQARLQAIVPLLEKGGNLTKADVRDRAEQLGTSSATIYRWIRAYRHDPRLTSLLPQKRGIVVGTTRLCAEAEKIIADTIEESFLNRSRRSISFLIMDIKDRCQRGNVKLPSESTIRRRVKAINDRLRAHRRHGRDVSKRFSELRGAFPGAESPLSVVQIDHTKADIILVDDVDRLPIGRPWLTLAIDVCTRVITGYYVSFEAPSGLATGMCVARSILPKTNLIGRFNLDGEWPVSGLMNELHCDNGKDFRGETLSRACQQYGITLTWRPVGKPEWGGHIERLMGTAASFINDLPGKTFSNIRDKGTYDSTAKAALTLSEFETLLVAWITGVYHQRKHSQLGMPPIKRYEQLTLGSETHKGIGLPSLPDDPERLVIDFMPFVERSVQRYGLQIDGVRYCSDVLRNWIAVRDQSGKPMQFIVRRDPRDISHVYFFDPKEKTYFEIPYADARFPPMTLWELREVRSRLRRDGFSRPDEEQIFRTWTHMREVEASAVKKTKAARRSKQRKKSAMEQVVADRPYRPASEPSTMADDDLANMTPTLYNVRMES